MRSNGLSFTLPLLGLIVLGFGVPILFMLGFAFWDKTSGFTFGVYRELASTPAYLNVLVNTLKVAITATLINVVIGYPLALWMAGLSNFYRMIALSVVVLSFWVSILVRTYAWIVVLGNDGVVNRLLQWSGLIERPISFLYNQLGVTIGMANVLLPFLVLPLFAAMIRIDKRLLQAAASLGASPRTIFWRVYFPLTRPALVASTLLVFILSMGFYVTPAVLGGGRVPMISNLMDALINQFVRWDQAAALSTLLLIATVLVFMGFRKLERGDAS
jgi:ABC-type spermidine/putrescine transport system permease subunit I